MNPRTTDGLDARRKEAARRLDAQPPGVKGEASVLQPRGCDATPLIPEGSVFSASKEITRTTIPTSQRSLEGDFRRCAVGRCEAAFDPCSGASRQGASNCCQSDQRQIFGGQCDEGTFALRFGG